MFKRLSSWTTQRNSEKATEVALNVAIEAASRLGVLMEQHPIAFLDVSMLPLPKPTMKSALKLAWQMAEDDRQRGAIEVAYGFLSYFQEGVGRTPISGQLPSDLVLGLSEDPMGATKRTMDILGPFVRWSETTQGESEALAREFAEFKEQAARRP